MSQLALMLLYIVGLGALWWFIGRKNRERNKKLQEQMNALKAGDHIVTIGGLHGIVHYIDTDAQTVEIDCDGVYLTFERRAIHHVVPTVGENNVPVVDGE
ncbi:preprotein translocase subunit YajC [uncultured Granulicatella sp.]|uniref:preprotein translocase subunit YajC n=1 Tax=uncultured Granulicatella sp. TaxID=316089 RepID=UPI0028D76B65|nr:preprotein translocase subunit YajC [uncultured Granulicatella sp.]